MDVAMHVPAFYTLPFPEVFTLTYMEYAYLLSIHVRSPLSSLCGGPVVGGP